MRPIDADRLKEYKCSICDNRERCEDRETVCSDIAEIDEQPTIEAKSVKHGRWNPIETTGIYFIKVECSTCDALIEYIEPRADNYIICPWCGSINGR